MNTIVSCGSCEWSAAADRGDLVVTTQDADGTCTEHRVIPMSEPVATT